MGNFVRVFWGVPYTLRQFRQHVPNGAQVKFLHLSSFHSDAHVGFA